MCVPGTENSETVPTNGLWGKTGLLSFWSSTNISMVVGFSSRSPLGDNAKALSYTHTHTQYKYNRKCVRIKYHCACHKHPTMEASSAELSWKLNLNWTYFLRSFKFWLIHGWFFFPVAETIFHIQQSPQGVFRLLHYLNTTCVGRKKRAGCLGQGYITSHMISNIQKSFPRCS